MDIKFLITAFIISQFVDWVFQWQWQALNKSKWGRADDKRKSFAALMSHALVYSAITTIALFALSVISTDNVCLVFFFLLITHGLIDTRVPVKWLMRFKGVTPEQIGDSINFGFMHIGIDHRLHEISLLILALLV